MALKIIRPLKDFILYTGLLRVFSPLNHSFQFSSNFNKLTQWVRKNRKGLLLNDYYSVKRDYSKRYRLYQTVASHFQLSSKEIVYLEFGVASAASFKWWLKSNDHPASRFFGFDTFEGLPEAWGSYFKKGDMSAPVPEVGDKRARFYKGIFQETLNGFIDENRELLKRQKIVHLDADLFSSTIFVLSQLYPHLKKGDILIFDEFNVANHEFFAYRIFTEAFYVNLRPVAAVNNYYQVAFTVE